MYGDSSLPSSSTAPSGLSCCCNVVVVVYHWTSDANLCFALALCPLLVVVHILLLPCSSTPPSVPPFIVSVWSVTFYFTLFIFYFFIFILTSLSPSPSLFPSLLLPLFPSLCFFNACDVCIGLLWCDQSSTPKFTRKIKTPAHTKTLHHDWLPATTYLALCLLLCVHPLACPALIGGCFFVPSLWLAVLMTNGVVHQNMGFLLTGITSVRSVSTKSKARVSPWGMTPPSLRREYHHIVSFMQRTTQDSLLHLRGPCVMLETHSFSLGYQIYLWIYWKLIGNFILF